LALIAALDDGKIRTVHRAVKDHSTPRHLACNQPIYDAR
jgi:hypothetical protein